MKEMLAGLRIIHNMLDVPESKSFTAEEITALQEKVQSMNKLALAPQKAVAKAD